MRFRTVVKTVSGAIYVSDPGEETTREDLSEVEEILFKELKNLKYLTLQSEGTQLFFNPDNIECLYTEEVIEF